MKNNYRIVNPGYDIHAKQFTHAHGNLLFDENETPYIDMAMGAGSLILGHSPSTVVDKVKKQSEKSSIFLQNNPGVQALSEKVASFIPAQLNNHIYCNTGSEATQRAVRLARAATGKTHIASFQGGWHGMNEWTLLDDGGRFGETQIKSYSGIPDVALTYSLLLPYNDDNIWQTLEQNASKLAAIIIEPIQGSNPQPHIEAYLSKLVRYCKSLGILVIFDEIITGFRVAKGGAAAEFNLEADIVTYGKILGGGLPMGLVAFTDPIFESTFADPSKSILTGGTFSANPLSAAAGLATLNNLNEDIYNQINTLSDYFRDSLNAQFQQHEIPFLANGYKSINRVYFTNKPIKNRTQRDALELPASKQAKFRAILWEQGIIWPTNGILCMPSSQSKETLDEVINQVVKAALKVIDN